MTPPPPDPRRRRLWRTLLSAAALLTLLGLIAGYLYVTDASRVRAAAEQMLERLTGGRVSIRGASLTLFEGLRLDGVEIRADDAPDGLLFSARTVVVEYRLRSVLTGAFRPKRVVAVAPTLLLAQDAVAGRWNFDRLRPRERSPAGRDAPDAARDADLPLVSIRAGRLVHARTRDGQLTEVGSLGFEGWLSAEASTYRFAFAATPSGQGTGPRVEGAFDPATRALRATLDGLRVTSEVDSLLPEGIARWWREHELSGEIERAELEWRLGAEPVPQVQVALRDVTFSFPPATWLSQRELRAAEDMRRALGLIAATAAPPPRLLDTMHRAARPVPLRLEGVSGRLRFDADGAIHIDGLRGQVEGNAIELGGRIDGLRADAPMRLRLTSAGDLVLPAQPAYIATLPHAVQEVYHRLQPRGRLRLDLQVRRLAAGHPARVDGVLDILDGQFTFDRFPYPIRSATGQIVIAADPETGRQSIELRDLVGRGLADGPNAEARVRLAGSIAPLGPEAGVTLDVVAPGVHSEPPLVAAMPSAVRAALAMFDPEGLGLLPTFTGDFSVHIVRPVGLDQEWTVLTDIDVRDASGRLRTFPYPLEGVRGRVLIRPGHVDLVGLSMRRGATSVGMDGRIGFDEQAASTRLDLRVADGAIDETLIAAMPEFQGRWLRELGLAGRFDLEGAFVDGEVGLDYALRIALRGAAMLGPATDPLARDLTAALELRHDGLRVERLDARCGGGSLSLRGDASWGADPRLRLEAGVRGIELTPAVRAALTPALQEAWDTLRPSGRLDLEARYDGWPQQRPDWQVRFTPQGLSLRPTFFDYPFENVAGAVLVSPAGVTLERLVASGEEARVELAGAGRLGGGWSLRIDAADLPIDRALADALPPGLRAVVVELSMQGKADLVVDRLDFAPVSAQGWESSFSIALRPKPMRVEIGVPMDLTAGLLRVAGRSREGAVQQLSGALENAAVVIGGRELTELSMRFEQPAPQSNLALRDVRGRVASGLLAGQADLRRGDDATAFVVDLALRGADVAQLTGDTTGGLRGQLNASFALEGVSGRPRTRRGRGDVAVSGEQLMRLPLVFGLLQVASLSLPINTPFTEGSARYSIEGQRITFERIELRDRSDIMQGAGWLDLGSRDVRLRFATSSQAWARVPLIGELLAGARREMLEIRVQGKLSDPRLSTSAMTTLTTTVDQVLRADEAPTSRPAPGRP